MFYLRKILKVVIAAGGIIGAILGSIQLYDYFNKDRVVEYKKSYIPLVYTDVNEFRAFLEQNINKKVRFETQFSFDDVLAVNSLVHETCNYTPLFEAIRNSPDQISKTDIGLMEFKKDFLAIKEENYQSEEIRSYRYISCLDTIRIFMKEPERLRFSYGGTGTTSLPFTGLFVIEVRAFSGPRVEYTLREL